jgi:hypothetical protein
MQANARKSSRRSLINLTILAAVLVCLACVTAPLGAQSYRGSIRGVVHDSTGAVIVGATVTAKSKDTGLARSATTGDDGSYSILELSAGTYDVTASAKDFSPSAWPAIVEVGKDTALDFDLHVGERPGDVFEVTAATPLVETSQDVLGGVVDQQLVTELPLNGRDFGKLVALVPGVTVEGSGVAGTEKGFGQFNINGNRDRSNNYTLDGTDNNDPWFNNSALNQVGITGAPATLLPIDAIQEFNLQSQFTAEYGRNSGGVVNIITKSGTNELHGSAFEYLRNSAFDARNFFNATGDPQTLFINNQFGGSLGGPIVRDKTFFFAAYEGQRERVGSDFNFSVPTQAEITQARQLALGINSAINTAPLDAILSYFPTNTSDSDTIAGVVNDYNNLNNFIVKLDHSFNSEHSFAIRYAFGQNKQEFPFGSLGGYGSGSRLAPFAQISPTRVQVLSASLLSTLSASHINELRFGYTRFRNSFTSADALNPNPNVPDFGTGHTGLPEIDFDGYYENLGATAYSVPRARVSQDYQILDNFTWIQGAHTMKFGGEFRRAWVSAFNDNLERGLMTFSPCYPDEDPYCYAVPDGTTDQVNMLTQFYLGYSYPSANTGNTQRTTYNNGLAFFAQDEFRIRQSLTVTFGLRWEYFGPVSEAHGLLSNFPGDFSPTAQLVMVGTGGLNGAYNRDLHNFGPRIGVAWSPFQNTVVRAAYGIYYDYIPQDLMIANYTNSAGLATNPIGPQPVLSLDYNQDAFNGSAPGPVFGPISSGPNSIFVTPRNLLTPYVGEWNLNIQQQISKGAAIEAGYNGSKGTRLTRLYDANQVDVNTGLRPNPNYRFVDEFATISNSTYSALQLILRISNWHRFSGFSGYVLSKSLDDASDGIDFNFATAALPQDSTDLRAEKGPSTFDTKHRFTTALNYDVPAWSAIPKLLAEGFRLNTIVTVQSGRPIPIVNSGDTSSANTQPPFYDTPSNYHQRPDIVPGVDPIIHDWTPITGYLNANAFAMPDSGFGNLGRDAIYGPGFWNIDFSVTKDTKLTEKLNLQIRAEIFNVFNHPQFSLPGNSFGGSGFGQVTATPDVAQGNPGLGGGGPRVLQLAARFQF